MTTYLLLCTVEESMIKWNIVPYRIKSFVQRLIFLDFQKMNISAIYLPNAKYRTCLLLLMSIAFQYSKVLDVEVYIISKIYIKGLGLFA
jgi:hypothetical protein